MIRQTVILNGDRWTIVDVAPAEALAEMVASLLEDEGMVVMVRGAELLSDVLSNLGTGSVGAAVVLVPEADAERALALIADTVTDFQGEELDEVMRALAAGADPDELLGGAPGDDGGGTGDDIPADDEDPEGPSA